MAPPSPGIGGNRGHGGVASCIVTIRAAFGDGAVAHPTGPEAQQWTNKALTPEQIDQWRQRIRVSTFANYHVEMALALRNQGDGASAERSLRNALATMPNHGMAALMLVDLLNAEGRVRDAEAVRANVRGAIPRFDLVEWLAASRQVLADDRPEGDGRPFPDCGSVAAAAQTLVSELFALGRRQAPRTPAAPDAVPTELFVEGEAWAGPIGQATRIYLNAGRWTDAARLTSIGLSMAPQNADLNHLHGTALLILDRAQEALLAFEEATRSAHNAYHITIGRALALAKLGLDDKAIEMGWLAVRQSAELVHCLGPLAWICMATGDRQTLDRVIPRLRDHGLAPHPWIDLPLSLHTLMGGDRDGARAGLRKLFATPEQQGGVRLCLAMLPDAGLQAQLLPVMLEAGFNPASSPLAEG